MNAPDRPELASQPDTSPGKLAGTASGYPRDFQDNRFVYTVISPRARGLTVGINLNPDKHCNFDCVYCEVNRREPGLESKLDLPRMLAEFGRTLELIRSGRIRERAGYRWLRDELLTLRHVALSGDGEPTLCPNFVEAVEALIHLRARGCCSAFKLVLITNASGFDRPDVQRAIGLFTSRDEIWAKLDAGTQSYLNRINRPDLRIKEILGRILQLARQRPVVIQSLFPAIDNQGPPPSEIEAFALRLKELKDAGAAIPLVQIYSATRPAPRSECGHLPLRTLAAIAQRVREVAGLRAEVF